MIIEPPANSSPERNGKTLATLSVVICLLAPVATLAVTLPDGYLSLDGEGEGIFAVFLLSPYVLLALFAWGHRHRHHQSIALFVLTVLLVAFGVLLLAAEANGYRTALAESPRGPDYMRDRYQRMELFIVPVLQWLACAVIGLVLAIDACRRRLQLRPLRTGGSDPKC
jgi:hypothetical protein